QTALGIITARPGWARETLGLLRQWLAEKELDAGREESLRGALVAFCKDKAVQNLVADTLGRDKTLVRLRLLLLGTMARAPLEKLPPSWVRELGRGLAHADEKVVRQAVATVRAAGVGDFDATLLALAKNKRRPADLRVAALAAAAPRLAQTDAGVFEF